VVSDLPGHLAPERHRDLGGPRWITPWARRVYIAILLALIVLALLNVFGQGASTTTSAAPGVATLKVDAPKRLRGGLLYQVHIIVLAHATINQPRLVLSRDWFDGMTLNTSEPAALGEDSREGAVTWTYGGLAAGQRLDVFTEWQVNPTTKLGSRHPHVELDDGSRPITRVSHELTVFP
jgi:hypothetical protein